MRYKAFINTSNDIERHKNVWYKTSWDKMFLKQLGIDMIKGIWLKSDGVLILANKM